MGRATRAAVSVWFLAWLALLATASAQVPAVLAEPAAGGNDRSGCPSKLDYVVLASFADSSSMLAMTAYGKSRPRE